MNTYQKRIICTLIIVILCVFLIGSCVKREPINEFVKHSVDSSIVDKEKKKDISYEIKYLKFIDNNGLLEFQIHEITDQINYDIIKELNYDIYKSGYKEYYDGKAAGITTGVVGAITSFIIGIVLITNPPTKTTCMNYQTSSGMQERCNSENQTSVAGWTITLIGPPTFALVGYGLSKIKKNLKEEIKEEVRNKDEKNYKKKTITEPLYDKAGINIPVLISSNYPFFNQNNSIKASTDSIGKSNFKLTTIPENIAFNKNSFNNHKFISDLKYLGEEDKIPEIFEKIEKIKCSFDIKILKGSNNNKSFEFDCFKFPNEEVLKELVK